MIEGTSNYFQKMVVDYVAFIQLDKCDGDDQVIQPLVFSYSATLINQNNDENCGNHQLENIVLMYIFIQPILRTLMLGEMKDSEGELIV